MTMYMTCFVQQCGSPRLLAICRVNVIPVVSWTKVTKGYLPANLHGNLLNAVNPQASSLPQDSKGDRANMGTSRGWLGGGRYSC